MVPKRATVDTHGPGAGPVQSHDHPHGRGLACAVRPEEAGHDTWTDREAHIVDGDLVTVVLTEAPYLDHRLLLRAPVLHRAWLSRAGGVGRSDSVRVGRGGEGAQQLLGQLDVVDRFGGLRSVRAGLEVAYLAVQPFHLLVQLVRDRGRLA